MTNLPPESQEDPTVNTLGGNYIAGNVNTDGGDFVGRDKIVNEIHEETAYNVHGLTNPYLGLRAFTYEDRAIYAGREQTAVESLTQLVAPGATQTLLFITGASGSGKSSFTQAALLPKLETHYQKYGKTVRHALFRPSQQPMVMLQDALQQLHPTAKSLQDLATLTPKEQVNVLIIDQFEELFIQSVATQRDQFIKSLINPPKFEELQTHMIATMRSDYLNELFAHQSLWDVAKLGIELRAMSEVELRDAIQKPIQVMHPEKRLSPELLDRLVADANGDPSLLPLLQATLVGLWQKGSLTLGHYESLTSAIRQRAEMIYAYTDHDRFVPQQKRPPEECSNLLNVFLDLVHVSPDQEDRRDIRLRRSRVGLEKGDPQRRRLIEELINARLLTSTTETIDNHAVEQVDIIHETLLRNWDRLCNAIDDNRRHLQQRARFKLWLDLWLQNSQSDEHLLLTNVQLAEARALNEKNDIELQNPDAHNFYQRSLENQEAVTQRRIKDAEDYAQAQARSAKQLRSLVTGLSIVTLLALTALITAIYQNRLAMGATLAAQARNFIRDQNLQMAAMLAIEAIPLNRTRGEEVLNEIPFEIPFYQTIRLQGHRYDILSVAWSPDGKLLASGALDNTVIVWDATSKQEVRRFQGDNIDILSVTWSPDGKQLASGSLDNTVIVWDVMSGQEVHRLHGHSNAVRSVAWSPNGKQLASGSWDTTIIVWDMPSGEMIRRLKGNNAEILSVAWSPNGKQLASGSVDNKALVWDVLSGDLVRTLQEHSDAVWSVAWSPDGKQLATGSWDNTIIIWDALTWGEIHRLHLHNESINSVAWSPDSRQLASGSQDTMIVIWNVVSGEKVRIPQGHSDAVWSVAWSPDGSQLASGSGDNTIIVQDAFSGEKMRRLQASIVDVNSVTWSPDGSQLASGSGNIYGGSSDNSVIIWDAVSGEKVRTLQEHSADIFSVAWSPDGSQLASGLGNIYDRSSDNSVIMWDTVSGEKVRTLQGHSDAVWSVAWSPNGSQLASGSKDNSVIMWDVASGEKVHILQGHSAAVWSVAWSPNGSQLASGSRDNSVIVWDAMSGKKMRTLQGHNADVLSVMWSPDGSQLASGSKDNSVIVWDATNGEKVRTLQVHRDAVLSVVWSPDGSELASGSHDGTILIYPRQYIGPPCQWSRSNLTLDEWLIYRGWVRYRPTCPQFSSSTLPGAIESWNTNRNYLFLSIQGWLFLLSIALIAIVIMLFLTWGCIRLARLFREKPSKEILPQFD